LQNKATCKVIQENKAGMSYAGYAIHDIFQSEDVSMDWFSWENPHRKTMEFHHFLGTLIHCDLRTEGRPFAARVLHEANVDEDDIR